MKKKFSLQPLITLAQHRNDSATIKLGHLNRLQHNAQSKLELLQQYRSDYQSRLQASTQNGMNPSELRNFQSFISKLDEAIQQQLTQVKQSKISTQIGRNEFESAQQKLKSFDTLKQRHTEIQKNIVKKSEQIDMDEHASRAAALKAINANNPSN